MSCLNDWKVISGVLGLSITRVRRKIFDSDQSLDHFEEEADGITELTFGSSEFVFTFYPSTETCSITMKNSQQPIQMNVSWDSSDRQTPFWKNRLNVEITDIYLYGDSDENVVAIEFKLRNTLSVVVQYVVDNGNVFDALNLSSHYSTKEGEIRKTLLKI